MYDLLDWLADTGVASRAAAALGMPTVADEKREREFKARDWSNTGTCPCCGMNVKMRDGKLVLHGYRRPGDGSTHGQCFGVGYEPYERSTKGCEDYKALLFRHMANLETRLVRLDDPDFTGTYETKDWRGNVTVHRKGESARWERLHENAKRRLKAEIRMVNSDYERMDQLIADWKPGMKMPEEIARERGWLK